jgi:hypothetical protein
MGPQTLKWLHRVGYATTIVVVAELIGLSVLALYAWKEDRKRLAWQMEGTRTRSGPFKSENYGFRPSESDLFATLPPARSLHKNGLRFVAAPSLRDPWFAYAVMVPPGASRAEGILRIFPHPSSESADLGSGGSIKFTMPAPAAYRLLHDIEHLTQDFAGERLGCLDGTGVGFELVTAEGVTSGGGNSACSAHYGELSALVLNSVRRLIPVDVRPEGTDWRPLRERPLSR